MGRARLAALAPWILLATAVVVLLPRTLPAIAAALVPAAAFYPALRLSRSRRTAALAASCTLLAATPLLVPPETPLSRALAAVFAATFGMKLYDLHVGAARGSRPDLGEFLRFLPNVYIVVLRKAHLEPRPERTRILLRLLRTLIELAVAFVLLRLVFGLEWRERPFLLEHTVKAVLFGAAIFPMMQVAVHLLRLAGSPARDFARAPFLARTPAEFWRRYNRVIQQFFFEDVFRRVGGLRSPVRGTLVTFVVSGLIHEYLLAIAIGRVEGYMIVFFLIQGLGVAASARLRPAGGALLPAAVATWTFLILSFIPFFVGLDAVVGFYASGAPGWLW